MTHIGKIESSHNANSSNVAGGDDQASISAEMLIMMAIEDMNNTLDKKTTLDAQMSSNLANVESDYMNYMNNGTVDGVTPSTPPAGTLAYDILKLQTDTNNNAAPGQIQTDNAQFGLDQTTATTTDNLIKSVESTSTTATSSDNSNMSNFMQFASSAVQLMGFAVQLLQHAM